MTRVQAQGSWNSPLSRRKLSPMLYHVSPFAICHLWIWIVTCQCTTVCANWSFPPRLHLCSSLCGESGLQHLLNPPGRERGCRELRPALSYIPWIWACHTIPSVAPPRPSSFPRMYALYAFNSQWMSLNVASLTSLCLPSFALQLNICFGRTLRMAWRASSLHCSSEKKWVVLQKSLAKMPR